MNDCTVCLSFDFDALSGRLFRGESSPTPLSRGEFGARAGIYRVLDLLKEHDIPATFFIPGHTIDTFPEQVKLVVNAGYEIAHHGYCHEVPNTLSREDEDAIIQKGIDAIVRACGKPPTGYRSPSWDLSPHSLELLLAHGFRYESSLMADDFTPYLCRIGDVGDTSGPYRFGKPAPLVELPISWILDDYPYFELTTGRAAIMASPDHVEQIWREEFEFMYERVPGGVFTLTMHPQVIGRGHRIRLLERLVRHMKGRAGVRFAMMHEVAEAARPRLLAAAGITAAAAGASGD